MNNFNQAYGEDGSILQSQKKLNSWDISTQRCIFSLLARLLVFPMSFTAVRAIFVWP